MKATCKFPGKDWDDNYNPGKKKTQAKFILEDGEEVNVNASNSDSPKADFLRSLKRGQEVILSKEKFHKDGETKEYWDIDTWALIGSMGSGGVSSESQGFMDTFAASRKRAKWFQQQGIELACELAKELDPTDENIPFASIFERGGAIGTSLHLDMINKGHR